AHNTGTVYISNGSGVIAAYNMFIGGNYGVYSNSPRIRVQAGSPEIFSNGFINGTDANIIFNNGSPFVTNNAYSGLSNIPGSGTWNLNPVTDSPSFTDFDEDNSTFDLDAIDDNSYDLKLADGSAWIDAGRTGTPYLDLDGSRSDIGIYAGPTSFSDGRGAPSVPVVIQFQVTPTTVSPAGTITITATGRIGDGSN
ncbi:MAG: hypothetical protein ACPGGA_08855, partial [Balneolaceae bacterium]